MKRIALALLVGAAALGAAPAEAGKRHGSATFSGSCSFSGSVTFEPPLTGTPRQGRGFATAHGRCNGRPATYVAFNEGLVSCQEGIAQGGGYLKIRGRRLRFRLTETRAAAAAALHIEGRRSGSAEGSARVSEEEDPADIAAKCLGSGLRSAEVDIDLTTTSPLRG